MMGIKTRRLRIDGMTCASCQNRIEKALNSTIGVKSAKVSYSTGTAEITYDANLLSLRDIIAVIEKSGYRVLTGGKAEFRASRTVGLLLIIAALFWFLQYFGILNLLVPTQLAEAGMGYGMLFVIGLITSVHCVAMCGGINLSQCIPQNEAHEQGKLSALRPTFLYNLGRVISYTVVGFIVGAIGSAITFSNTLQGILKLIAGVFMVIMGINMLGIFPWLKKLNPRMPKFLSRKITAEKSMSKSPLIVGLLNGLMPCGPLQAMQIYALSTGSPFTGALSMLVFSLGTVPLMFGLGALSTILSKKFTRRMMTAGAVLVAVLGLSMLSQGWSLSGFNLPQAVSQSANGAQSGTDTDGAQQMETNDGTQVVNSTLSSGGYPSITVQAGTPVKWVIDAPEGSINGCNNRMILREYDIEHRFKTGENVITFTPTETGKFQYTCWMGMIRGTITVVEAGTNSSSANAAVPSAAPATPTPAVYAIPTDNVAIATLGKDQEGNDMQTVEITLTEEGFSPAILVVERGTYVEWKIRNQVSDTAELMVPLYSTSLPLDQEENSFAFFPDVSFDFSTGDNAFYGYVKVVDDLDAVNIDAIKAEVAAYVPSASSQDGFTGGGGGCCG